MSPEPPEPPFRFSADGFKRFTELAIRIRDAGATFRGFEVLTKPSLAGKIIRFVKTSADEGVLVICQPGGKIITMFAPPLEYFLKKAH